MEHLIFIIKETTPFGAIALSLIVIYQLIKQKKQVISIKDNHLHDIAETLKRIEGKIEKIGEKIDCVQTGIEILKEKINRKK